MYLNKFRFYNSYLSVGIFKKYSSHRSINVQFLQLIIFKMFICIFIFDNLNINKHLRKNSLYRRIQSVESMENSWMFMDWRNEVTPSWLNEALGDNRSLSTKTTSPIHFSLTCGSLSRSACFPGRSCSFEMLSIFCFIRLLLHPRYRLVSSFTTLDVFSWDRLNVITDTSIT